MILAALLLLQAAPAADAHEVVVIGPRLERAFKANVRFRADGPQCKIGTSTGDAEIDRIGCRALEVCFPPFQSRFAATRDRAIKPSTRKVMQGALNQELTACFKRERTDGIAALVARRRAARRGG